MSHLAIIEGVSGRRWYLDREGGECESIKRAKKFPTEVAAGKAAREHIAKMTPVVQRHVKFEVVPAPARESDEGDQAVPPVEVNNQGEHHESV